MFTRTATSTLLRAGSARGIATAAARPAAQRQMASRLAGASAVLSAVGLASYALSTRSSSSPIALEGPRTLAGEYKTTSERSFFLCKPDAVSRQIVHKMIQAFEERGYKLVAIKSVVVSEELAREHYSDLSSKPFFNGLVKYLSSGTPVIAMVWEGKDVIRQGRRILGATNPQDSDPGTLRGRYSVSVGRNLFHGSDSFESVTKEIGLWFSEKELAEYEPITWPMIMADN